MIKTCNLSNNNLCVTCENVLSSTQMHQVIYRCLITELLNIQLKLAYRHTPQRQIDAYLVRIIEQHNEGTYERPRPNVSNAIDGASYHQ